MAQAGNPGLPAPLQHFGHPAVRQGFGLILAAATAVALLTGAWLWGQTPDYRVLFASVADRDGGEIVAALTQMNVPYKFAEGGGAILVPADKVHDARLRLAAQGLPRGSGAGFELMEKSKLGTSQFLEQVNYQRALEGELARSIQAVAAVETARVHLAIPKPSVFLRETQKPSASVLLNLRAGRTLESAQVSAIVHLVSSSVADLPIANVTVVDQNGSLMSSNGAQENGLDPGQLRYLKEVERGLTRRIETILEPMLGGANVRAQVTADLDFSQTEAAEELYRPNQAGDGAVRTTQSSEAVTVQGGSAAGGVPGAYSNQPPAPAAAPITGAQPPAQGATAPAAPTSTQKGSTTSYEVDKTIRHTRQPVGAVKRLSVAVVINHKRSAGADGKPAYTPRTEAEMQQIQDLVRQAVGFNEARGDSVTVANTPFTSEERVEPEPVPLWKQPGAISTAQDVGKHLLIALVVLFVFLKVLRPMFQNLLAPVQPLAQLPGQVMLPPDSDPVSLPQSQPKMERNLDAAKQIARQEPKLVASIVKNWVSGDER
jgi:flagellar M-ring protein FliF